MSPICPSRMRFSSSCRARQWRTISPTPTFSFLRSASSASAIMRRVVGPDMGVKAAGGVRDLEQVKAMAAAGASRIGASAGVKIVRESRGEKVAAPASGY